MSLSLAEHTRTATRVCFAAEVDEVDLDRLGSPERWRTYRTMVRTRLQKVLRAALPRAHRALGSARMQTLFRDWLDRAPPTARYFRAIPESFVGFCTPLFTDADPRYVRDLASYELACWTAKYADERAAPAIATLAFDRPLVLHPSVHLLKAQYGVHSRAADAKRDYREGEQWLCVYRDAEHEAITMELNPIAFALMDAWASSDAPLAESTQLVARARDARVDEAFIDGLSSILDDFLRRGIILGSRAA